MVLLVVISLGGGYLAYPYFNAPDPEEVSRITSSQRKYPTSLDRPGDSGITDSPDSGPSSTPPSATQKAEEKFNQNRIDKKRSMRVSDDNHDEEDLSGTRSQNNGLGSQTFRAGSERDFSNYKLSKKTHPLSLSPRDPRLLLIKGFYEGFYDSSTVDLEIGGSESSIQFVNNSVPNEEMSFSAPNETFFTNVHDNGNLLMIEKGKSKLYIDLQSWPTLKLMMGTKTEVLLRKTR